MFPKKSYIIFILLLFSISGFTQNNKITKLANSIVDSVSSDYDRAKSIYTWICSNIKYDVEKYTKLDLEPQSAEETLKKKKGIGQDFAELMKSMCRSVNIEAYTVNGYSKGYNHYDEMPFLRANHVWNILHVGSEWIVVDPTWGAGYLISKPKLLTKPLYALTRKAYTNNKLLFVQKTSESFFDIPADSLASTNYPLDPNWFLSGSAVSFYQFAGDTGKKNISLPNYRDHIEEIRRLNEEHQFIEEGIYSNKLNRYNKFDIAMGYLYRAKFHNIDKTLGEDNLDQFENYNKDFEVISSSITKHREINDSIYRARLSSLKNLAYKHRRFTSRIKAKTKSAKKAKKSRQKNFSGKSSSYNKKLSSFVLDIGRAELKKLVPVNAPETVIKDSSTIKELMDKIKVFELQEPQFQSRLDSLRASVENRLLLDKKLSDSIVTKNSRLNKTIVSLQKVVLTDNEQEIREYVDSITSMYSDITEMLDIKKNSKKDVENNGKQYYSTLSELKKMLKDEFALYKKLYVASKHNRVFADQNNNAVERLIQSNKDATEFTYLLTSHHMGYQNIDKQNLDALKEQKKNITKEYKFFVAWHNKVYNEEKKRFEYEKEIIREISSIAKRKKKKVELKLNKYYASTEEE